MQFVPSRALSSNTSAARVEVSTRMLAASKSRDLTMGPTEPCTATSITQVTVKVLVLSAYFQIYIKKEADKRISK